MLTKKRKLEEDSVERLHNEAKQLEDRLSEVHKQLGGVRLFVKTLAEKCIAIFIKSNATIKQVKEAIEEVEGIEVDQQRLIFAGKQLNDERTLEEYKIGNACLITLVARLCGS